MIIFSEGKPRAGKSYDAVLTHIVPALKKGRKVYARLDGLDFEAIAAYLDVSPDFIRGLLTILTVEDVARVHEIATPDSLVVIDECHKFYVQSMRPLPAHVEDWFAEHGHHGMDILLLSQAYKRVHTAVRCRIERKNHFQKLTAVGMKDSYLVKYFHSTDADKYEQVGKARKKYDPAIYPLYHGYTPETENTEVYEEGGTTVWRTVLPWFVIATVLLIGGGVFYARFFASGGGAKQPPKTVTQVPAVTPSVKPVPSPVHVPKEPVESKPKRPKMPPEPAYIWSLQDQGRARLAGTVVLDNGQFVGLIEWRADKSRVIDALSIAQIREMGVRVDRTLYGVRLSWGKGDELQTIVVTGWPLDVPDSNSRYSRQDIQNIRETSPYLAQSIGGYSGAPSPVASGGSGRDRATATPYVPPTYGDWQSDPWGGK